MKRWVLWYWTIAPSFIESLQTANNQTLHAISSVTHYQKLIQENLYPWTTKYNNYPSLYDDNSIDIVYICTTNNLHKENIIHCLESWKHVLCEKPLCMTKNDVEEVVTVAQRMNKFLMEWMRTRFFPAYRSALGEIQSWTIWNVKSLKVDFWFKSERWNERRLLNKQLFWWIIYDNTDYNLFLAHDIFWESPSSVSIKSQLTDTWIEHTSDIIYWYNNSQKAYMHSSFVRESKHNAVITGDKWTLIIEDFRHPRKYTLINNDWFSNHHYIPYKSTWFIHEIEHVDNCITQNVIESPIIPHALSKEIAHQLETLHKQIHWLNSFTLSQ